MDDRGEMKYTGLFLPKDPGTIGGEVFLWIITFEGSDPLSETLLLSLFFSAVFVEGKQSELVRGLSVISLSGFLLDFCLLIFLVNLSK